MDNSVNEYKTLKCMKILVPVVGIGIILTIVTFGIAIATLVKVNQGFDKIETNSVQTTPSTTARTTNPITTTTQTTTTTTTTTTNRPFFDAILPKQIHIQQVMDHLNELQRIATGANGNRAIHTTGFNHTLDYITDVLNTKTNFIVKTSFFPVRKFDLSKDPVFSSLINDTITNYTYSKNLSISDFSVARYSTSVDFPDYIELVVIPNEGCSDIDWNNTNLTVVGRVALVKRGTCTFIEKAKLAMQYNASAILIYNHGSSDSDIQPITIDLGQENKIPALFLSHNIGQQLIEAIANPANNVTIYLNIAVLNDLPSPVGNICADTPTGDPKQTIVIGSHSDSVPEGPGINDNGSGSAANLGLAIALARLFNTSSYTKYPYRVRFCWWGAEEVGLLGSRDHVRKAKNATDEGERLQDYLINLNYDMLGSPNFMFGIYNDETAKNDTPSEALPGSKKISNLFRDWFNEQKLPWTNTDFDGRSDYGPFLAEGIVAGGLATGAEKKKTVEERDRYEQLLGQGLGGLADVAYDSCYHQACDSIQNINVFAYANMVQGAAYALEYLARQDNLTTWLYPNGRPIHSISQTLRQEYVSYNEYFRLPYY